jgi:acetyl esterase/lipase
MFRSPRFVGGAVAAGLALGVIGCAETDRRLEFTEVSGLEYLDLDGDVLDMDVYVPTGDGPWPILVTFHGNSAEAQNSRSNTVVAEEAAARGMLVFAPSWIPPDPFPLGYDDIQDLAAAGRCAVAFAQEKAPEFGGDPRRTAVHGFSAGTGPAHSVAIDPPATPTPGCVSDLVPSRVSAVALSDGEYFFHSAPFDGAFVANPVEMQDRVGAWIDHDRWPPDLGAEFYLWAAEEGTAPRLLDDTGDGAGWLALRDPDGTIRADLGRLGRVDDGIVDDADSAALLSDRLAAAGLGVEFETFAGGHRTDDKAGAIVDEIERMLGKRS